jgi:hypothetical protein
MLPVQQPESFPAHQETGDNYSKTTTWDLWIWPSGKTTNEISLKKICKFTNKSQSLLFESRLLPFSCFQFSKADTPFNTATVRIQLPQTPASISYLAPSDLLPEFGLLAKHAQNIGALAALTTVQKAWFHTRKGKPRWPQAAGPLHWALSF